MPRRSLAALTVLFLGWTPPAHGTGSQPQPSPDSGARATTITAADGGAIGADVYGTGPRGVVLLHGGRFDRTSWKPQATALVAAGFRVIAIDFRASVEARAGRDTGCGYDSVCLAKDAHAAVRYLRESGATSVAIIGASRSPVAAI